MVDIPAGQLILNELPIICGPRQMTKPVCLGCHKELTDPKQKRNRLAEVRGQLAKAVKENGFEDVHDLINHIGFL